jgi:hypothetical protein
VQRPPSQRREPQSVGAVQATPSPQLAQGPPQSTPASVPLRTPSLQLAQRWPSHRDEAQSAPAVQVRPSAQSAQFGPPQSTSVSPWLRI